MSRNANAGGEWLLGNSPPPKFPSLSATSATLILAPSLITLPREAGSVAHAAGTAEILVADVMKKVVWIAAALTLAPIRSSMFVSRRISTGFVCNACRGAFTRQVPPIASHDALRRATPKHAFSTGATRRVAENTTSEESLEASTLEPLNDRSSNDAETAANVAPPKQSEPISNDTSIPWYLRQSPPRYMDSAVPGQQAAEIPDLPPNPPPLLATLLEYISVTAGLDDLQLLDLRHLDPPPALGPKLIMLIGTARSEKHLHVAADRFCRYLRREHGLKANAAGLLGRNELKIKLRRKAKRMRMLANVGGTMPTGNIDDGIRTGWICCTLGKIEAHPEDQHMPGDNIKDFVGFRDAKPGVNVVVQMFTEEKRIETDLETLWGGVVRTHQRLNQKTDESLEELERDIEELEDDGEVEEEEQIHAASTTKATKAFTFEGKAPKASPVVNEVNPPDAPTPQFRRPRPSAGDPFPPLSSSDKGRQLRRIHTVGLNNRWV